MTLTDHFSSFLDDKIKSLELTNRINADSQCRFNLIYWEDDEESKLSPEVQKAKIVELEQKNAILHLRLSAAIQLSQTSYEQRDSYCTQLKDDHLRKTHLKKKLQFLESEIKHIKQDLITLSEDMKEMFQNVNLMFDRFSCSVVEKIRNEQEYKQCNEELNSTLFDLQESLKSVQDLHLKEKERRKELHNLLVQMRGNIRVHCRVRPMLDFDMNGSSLDDIFSTKSDDECRDHNSVSFEKEAACEEVVRTVNDEVVSVNMPSKKQNKLFEFEKVYSAQDDQTRVFHEIQPLITSFLDGYNVCVMAYGQTGSGKSHSMLGTNAQPGIAPRAAEELFRLIQERGSNVSLEVSVAEVYNNDIFDLLSDEPKREKHCIVTSGEGGKDVPTLNYIKVDNASEIENLIEHGLNHRAQIATKVHEHSSRSHLIVSITATFQETFEHQLQSSTSCHSEPNTPRKKHQVPSLVQGELETLKSASKRKVRRQLPQPHPPSISHFISSPITASSHSVPSSPIFVPAVHTFKTKLQLVDLAGSECVGLSGAKGTALRESSYINRSLSALADVLSALSENRSHVPYRNSRLTHLLQDSIGGEAKMLVLLCVSPGKKFITETLQCLGFGNRARQVQRGQTKRRGFVSHHRAESPGKPLSPRQSRSVVVRRVFN